MQQVDFYDPGIIDFKECWDLQEHLLCESVNRKMQNRDRSAADQAPVKHSLIFCEHPHVYTLGKSGLQKHLLISEEFLKQINATYYSINRGGDITYHGPGQLVGYPIFDLDHFFNDIHRYLRCLEEAVILTLAEYNIAGDRIKGLTGVWLDAADPAKARKICAFGVRCSRWITMHGFAFNVNTDLSYFNHIVPCGITDKAVTSLQKELGRVVDMREIKLKLLKHIAAVFNCNISEKNISTIFNAQNH